ncbi:MAG: hypothetical protein M1836_003986 [Candelina mexicana]|nr:MAG: hypothetical protein M1836_003986 [Candelina mexicana]
MGAQYSKYFVSQERIPNPEYIAQPTKEQVPGASRVEPSTETSLVTARELKKQLTFNESMKETLANLMRSVRAGKHNAAEHILRYIETHSEASLYKGLLQSVCYHTSVLFSGLENGFEDLNLAALGSTVSTKMQGVYAIVLRWKSGSWRIYIGSAFGVKGIAGRVNRRHKNLAHRQSKSGSYLYYLIDHPDVEAYYMTLATFEDLVDNPMVVVTEAVLTCLFGSYDTETYRNCRPKGIPTVLWKRGVNRSDPLSTDDHVALAREVNKGKWDRALALALEGGERKVWRNESNCSFGIVGMHVTIPKPLANDWNLVHGDTIRVHYGISEGRHEHPFVPDCSETDDGRRLGIRISKTVQGVEKSEWLQ